MEYHLVFYLLLPIIAFLYASVGHGGASGYLALMAFFGSTTSIMKPSALILNIMVSALSFYFFYRYKYFKWVLFYPFAISSIPAAFIGGYLSINPTLYKHILAVILLFSILRLLGFLGKESPQKRPIKLWQGLIIGAVVGLLSGMIGIGGGIILSPLILIFKWGDMKSTAATSALFIWVNSLAALIGLLWAGQFQADPNTPYFILIALVGALFGAYAGSKKYNNKTLRKVLAMVLLVASVKLMTT